MLDDEDLWAGEAVHRAVVAMRLVPEWQDSLVIGITQTRNSRHQETHQHLTGSVSSRLSAEPPIGHVLRIPREVGAGAPDIGTSGA